MRAVVVDRWMEPNELAVRECEEPEVGPDQVGIEVRAAGCNFFDLLIVRGRYQVKPPLPFVPGGEVAGVVRDLGVEVEDLAVGDRVLAQIPWGGFAEHVAAPASVVQRIPAAMPFEEAAAFPIVYGTSYAALVDRATLQSGETLLVHAAAGGVGLAAVQIGKALGARVIGTAGGSEKIAVVRAAGADVVVDYRDEDFVERVRDETEGRGADVIYDSVGGDILDRSLKCIAWGGRLLVIGFASGAIPSIRANRILLKNVALVGLHWSAYPQHEPERVRAIFAELFGLYERGAIRPLVSACYALEELPVALAALGERRTRGKVVIVP